MIHHVVPYYWTMIPDGEAALARPGDVSVFEASPSTLATVPLSLVPATFALTRLRAQMRPISVFRRAEWPGRCLARRRSRFFIRYSSSNTLRA
jgi:hypothetical protein